MSQTPPGPRRARPPERVPLRLTSRRNRLDANPTIAVPETVRDNLLPLITETANLLVARQEEQTSDIQRAGRLAVKQM
jgi:hypothetical protein